MSPRVTDMLRRGAPSHDVDTLFSEMLKILFRTPTGSQPTENGLDELAATTPPRSNAIVCRSFTLFHFVYVVYKV